MVGLFDFGLHAGMLAQKMSPSGTLRTDLLEYGQQARRHYVNLVAGAVAAVIAFAASVTGLVVPAGYSGFSRSLSWLWRSFGPIEMFDGISTGFVPR